jgi:hypothetical protein
VDERSARSAEPNDSSSPYDRRIREEGEMGAAVAANRKEHRRGTVSFPPGRRMSRTSSSIEHAIAGSSSKPDKGAPYLGW